MPSSIQSYRDLLVWQRAMDLADLVYELTERFPRREHLGLAAQMRKAAVSIPSNIAEGTRHKTAGYISRVVIALGEHAELETQTLLGARRKYVTPDQLAAFEELSAMVGRLAHGLVNSLEAKLDTDSLRH
jgi:four helix bundle protein